jgi:glycosyltransferase involved in cell wall biosynthesis
MVQAFFYNNTDNYPPIVNGIHLLTGAGFTVDMFCRDDGLHWNVSYPPASHIYRIGSLQKSSWSRYLAFVFRAFLSGSRHSVVFVGHDMHGLLPACLLSKLHKKPFVYHCHDFSESAGFPEPLGGRLVRLFERRFARAAKFVVVPDADRARVIATKLKLKNAPLIAANAPLTRTLGTGSILHEVLSANGRHFERVVFRQGRIGIGHGIEKTIESILSWSSKSWGFVLMGIGDASYIQRLNTLAKTLGVEQQFFVLPPVGYDRVCEFTPGASLGHALYDPIHINNVHIATASNKIMEYLEAGLPLLVSESTALRAMMSRLGCGLTANQDAPASIAAAVNTLLGDPERAHKMGLAARAAFEAEFCYERQFAPVIECIRGLAQ